MFVDAHLKEGVKIVATHLDLLKQPAAIVECSIGRGVAVLSGVHIEIGNFAIPNIHKKSIQTALHESEQKRKAFFTLLIDSLYQRSITSYETV